MLPVRTVNQFRKDLKKAKRQGKDTELLKQLITSLAGREPLADKYRDHALRGDYADCRECHLNPDWLLIYRLTEDELQLIRLGSHSELFG